MNHPDCRARLRPAPHHAPRLTRAMVICSAIIALATTLAAQPLQVTTLPGGYTAGSVELGQPYAGALAVDPAQPRTLYAATGFFGSHDILRIDADSGTTRVVASGFGNVGGLAVLANGDLAITENFTSDTTFRARDLDSDGAFLSPGEVTELIPPAFHDGNFSGSQLATAPMGNAAGIPAGALVLQTADGGTSGELLVILDPATAPAYSPADAPFADGLNYNGGFGFTSSGHLIVGSAGFLTGEILAMVNADNNDRIGPGERNVIVPASSLGLGVSDLAVSAEDVVFYGENSGNVKSFHLHAQLLTATATPAVFAQTNSTYLSTLRLDVPTRTFAPGASQPAARLYMGGYLPGFASATNLVFIEPQSVSSVPDWQVYE